MKDVYCVLSALTFSVLSNENGPWNFMVSARPLQSLLNSFNHDFSCSVYYLLCILRALSRAKQNVRDEGLKPRVVSYLDG
jgi:hypothetical protein